MRFYHPLLFISTTFLYSLPLYSYAEEKSPVPNLLSPVIIQKGASYSDAVRGYVATKSSTASKTGASILETPQSVSVVGQEELRDRNVQSTTQAIQYTPGIYGSTSAISQRFDYFSIRGFDATLNGALLDGLRSTTAQSYVHYQPYGLERIEVLRGPNGFLYGAGSPGGVVNHISKRPLDTPFHEVGVQYGNFKRAQAQFDFSGPINQDKRFLYRLVGVGRDSNTQFTHVPDDTGYLAPSFTWAPDGDTSLTILASLNRDEFGPPRPFVPIYGTLLPNKNGKLRHNTYLDGKDLNNHLIQDNIAYVLDHRVNDIWSVHSTSRFSYDDLVTNTMSGMRLLPDMRTLARTAYRFDITSKIFSSDSNAKAEWEYGEIKGTSVFGLSWRNTGEDYTLQGGRNAPTDIFHPDHPSDLALSSTMASTYQRSNEYGIYNANTLTFCDHVVLDVALRNDWVSIKTNNHIADSNASQDDNDFTYRVGLSYLTDMRIAPYVSYTTSFSPIIGTNYYGQPFEPMHGKQYEVGVKYEPKAFDGLFTLAWYNLTQDNVRTTDPDNRLNTIQTGEVRSKGVEFSATANVTTDFKLVANYTYNDLETTKTTIIGAKGKVPTGIPEHMTSLWADYTFSYGFLQGLSIGGGVRYVGKTYADTANTIDVPSVTLADAGLRYDFGVLRPQLKGLNLSVNANNLFNKHYYTNCSANSCNEGFERSVRGTLSYRW